MNLGASTSKLNVNSSDSNKQYIPSRIFSSQDKSNEEKNLASPPHTNSPIGHHLQSPGGLQAPNTPYSSYYTRSVGPYQSSSPSSAYNKQQQGYGENTPNLNRRFGGPYSINKDVPTSNINNNNNDLFSIPVSSIYEEPKQLKQQNLQQQQQQQLQKQQQINAMIQQQQYTQHNLYNQIDLLQSQQPQTTPPGGNPLSAQDLNQSSFYNQQQQPQLQQQSQHQYPQTPLHQQNIYNSNAAVTTNSPFLNIYNQQQQQQQQQNLSSPYNQTIAPTLNPTIQTVPSHEVTKIFSDKYDNRWLTVFGFSHDKTDLIVDELSKYGNIIEIEYPQQSNCNWVYVKFDSEYTSMDLLKKNGLILGNCMIGIVPCKEKIKNESDPIKPQSLQQQQQQLQQSQLGDHSYKSIEKRYQPARSDYDPQSFSNNNALSTPSRPSFLSKVSEYVFGST